ncbi:MAG: cobalamin-dependent protein [Anaerolineales bacterium]|nr:cobalamin-dependent protein [Anaerolineales bacterium]
MSKQENLEKLSQAIVDLAEDEAIRLVKECLQAGATPVEIINEGLNPGLSIIGEAFQAGTGFLTDLVIAGEMMNDAMVILIPEIQKGSGPGLDTMVMGTIKGDTHNIGKRIVGAMFIAQGYNVIDIGENRSASEFVEAIKEHKAKILGVSSILSPLKPYCKVIHEAMVEAGIRDDVIYIIGGWTMTQEAADEFGADAFGEDAIDAIGKIRALRSGELARWRDRSKI